MKKNRKARTEGRWRRLISGFLIGALGTAVLTSMRVAAVGGTGGTLFDSRGFFVAVVSAIGGVCGVIFTGSIRWRSSGGALRLLAYSVMGAASATLFFLLVVIDGGRAAGLAGEPVSQWIATYLVLLLLGVGLALVARKYFDWLGILAD